MKSRFFLIDHPFTDSDIVLSVEHLIMTSRKSTHFDEYDEFLGDLSDADFDDVISNVDFQSEVDSLWPVELSGYTNWLDMVTKASLNHLFNRRVHHVRQFMDEFGVFLGNRTLTEEEWIKEFEDMHYHAHQLSMHLVRRQRDFAASILNQTTDPIEVKRCIVKPMRNMAIVEIGNIYHGRESGTSLARRKKFARQGKRCF